MDATSPPTWSGTLGEAQVVTYRFLTVPNHPYSSWSRPVAVSEVMRATFLQALDLWSKASGLDFVEVPSYRFPPLTTSFVMEDIAINAALPPFKIGRDANAFARPGDRASITFQDTAPSLDDVALAVGTTIGVPAPPESYVFGEHGPRLIAVSPDLEAAHLLYGTAAEKAANGVSWRWDAEGARVQGVGNDGANRLSGTRNADELIGGAGDDILLGRDGDDLLRPGCGNDTLDGGSGVDVATFESLRGESALDVAAGTVSSAFGGTDSFADVEELRFVDGRVTLAAAPLSNEAVTIGLYRVLLDTAPDPGGLAYWVMRMDAVGAQQVAAGIMSHHVYQGRVAAGLARADLAPWTAVDRAKEVAAALPADGVWVPDAETMTLARLHHLVTGGAPTAAELRADRVAFDGGTSFAAIGQGLLDRHPGVEPYADGAALVAVALDWWVVAQFWGVAGARLALRTDDVGLP